MGGYAYLANESLNLVSRSEGKPARLPVALRWATVGELEPGERAWVEAAALVVDPSLYVYIRADWETRDERKPDWEVEIQMLADGVAAMVPSDYSFSRIYGALPDHCIPVCKIEVVGPFEE